MPTDLILGIEVRALVPSWRLHLAARNLSENTTYLYNRGMEVFSEFAEVTGVPTTIGSLSREHIELFLVWLTKPVEVEGHERPAYAPRSVAAFYDGVASFFAWAVMDGEITTNPMENVTKPITPERRIQFPTENQMRAVLAGIKGDDLEARRDRAIIRLFTGTGVRLSELTNVKWSEADPKMSDLVIDNAYGEVTVLGKGRRERTLSFGPRTAKALDKYLRARRSHMNADIPWFWISSKGRMTTSGIRQMLKRRGEAAGVPDLHPHALRHYFAHQYLAGDEANGVLPGSPEDLMRLLGHANMKMINTVYGVDKAEERARAANRRLSPGERL